jgi:hypothetical protein
MKLIFAIIFCTLNVLIESEVVSVPNVETVPELFTQAWIVQNLLSPNQQAMDNDVTQLRESLTDVLEEKSRDALDFIDTSTLTILAVEEPYKARLMAIPQSTCRQNLLSQLEQQTEESGYRSGLCVATYDTDSEVTITDAQEFISTYEGLFVRLQKTVIQSFNRRNAIIDAFGIHQNFTAAFNERYLEWQAIRPQVEDFEYNLSTDLTTQGSTLDSCLTSVREIAFQQYEIIGNRITVCEEFNMP